MYINEMLANDVLLVPKILLGYEEALWPKKLEISHTSQILTHEPQLLFFLSYLITTVHLRKKNIENPNEPDEKNWY